MHRIRGTKKQKQRITVFLVCNADGSEKLDATVIGHAETPIASRQAGFLGTRKGNLPVTYRHNQKAWMLSGIWYEFLGNLNRKMRLEGRRIALITDNCPSHPPAETPPKNYQGSLPPVLTHVKLIYLPKNTTPYLQPLDQGIIRSFKAGYRRKYAEHMVTFFNEKGHGSPPLDILQAILYISAAWEELPEALIFNCWQKTGIVRAQQKDSELEHYMDYESYMTYVETGTRFVYYWFTEPVATVFLT